MPEYIDHGDPNVACESCGALLWLAESKRGDGHGHGHSYSLCCGRGKVKLPVPLMDPPPLLMSLTKNEHPKSKSFLEDIRRYNSMFAFTSLGGKQDHSVNVGRGPYCYRLHGQNYHIMGDLLPKPGQPPAFAQLYIYDPVNEIRNRINAVRY